MASTREAWAAAVMGSSGACYWLRYSARDGAAYGTDGTCTGHAALSAAGPTGSAGDDGTLSPIFGLSEGDHYRPGEACPSRFVRRPDCARLSRVPHRSAGFVDRSQGQCRIGTWGSGRAAPWHHAGFSMASRLPWKPVPGTRISRRTAVREAPVSSVLSIAETVGIPTWRPTLHLPRPSAHTGCTSATSGHEGGATSVEADRARATDAEARLFAQRRSSHGHREDARYRAPAEQNQALQRISDRTRLPHRRPPQSERAARSSRAGRRNAISTTRSARTCGHRRGGSFGASWSRSASSCDRGGALVSWCRTRRPSLSIRSTGIGSACRTWIDGRTPTAPLTRPATRGQPRGSPSVTSSAPLPRE